MPPAGRCFEAGGPRYWYGLVSSEAPCSAAQLSAISSSLPKLAWQSSCATT